MMNLVESLYWIIRARMSSFVHLQVLAFGALVGHVAIVSFDWNDTCAHGGYMLQRIIKLNEDDSVNHTMEACT